MFGWAKILEEKFLGSAGWFTGSAPDIIWWSSFAEHISDTLKLIVKNHFSELMEVEEEENDQEEHKENQGWTKVGAKAGKKATIPKFILAHEDEWVWHDGNKFQSHMLEAQTNRSEVAQMRKLLAFYDKYDNKRKFVPIGLESQNLGACTSLIMAQNRYLKDTQYIAIF